MKNSWLVYVAVAAIAALAGIAIAGPPNTVSTDATIIVPETTTTTAPESEPAPTTTDATPDSTTTTSTTTTTTTTEVDDTTTTTEAPEEIDRAEVAVVVVNGASIGGLASRVRDELRDAGFEQARPIDGTTIVEATVVYFAEGFAAEAVDVAEALGLAIGDVKPIDDAPEFNLGNSQVAVYLGRDRA